MNHPNPKSEFTDKFLEENIVFFRIIEGEIKSEGLKLSCKKYQEKLHQCFCYEFSRTLKYCKDSKDHEMAPYLSRAPSDRPVIDLGLDKDLDLFKDELFLPKSTDLRDPPISNSVPIQINIGVNWSKADFDRAVKNSWNKLDKERENLISNFSKKGAYFTKGKDLLDPRSHGTPKKKLKLLGHFRLLQCCNLSWDEIASMYERFPEGFILQNQSEFKRELKEAMPLLYGYMYDDSIGSFLQAYFEYDE